MRQQQQKLKLSFLIEFASQRSRTNENRLPAIESRMQATNRYSHRFSLFEKLFEPKQCAANTQYLGKIGECTELAFQHCTNAARWSRSLAAKLRVCTQMIGFCRAFSLFAIRTHSAFSTHTASNTTGSSYPTGTCAMLQSSHAVRPERQIQKVLPNRSARVLEPRSSGVHLVVNTTTH